MDVRYSTMRNSQQKPLRMHSTFPVQDSVHYRQRTMLYNHQKSHKNLNMSTIVDKILKFNTNHQQRLINHTNQQPINLSGISKETVRLKCFRFTTSQIIFYFCLPPLFLIYFLSALCNLI